METSRGRCFRIKIYHNRVHCRWDRADKRPFSIASWQPFRRNTFRLDRTPRRESSQTHCSGPPARRAIRCETTIASRSYWHCRELPNTRESLSLWESKTFVGGQMFLETSLVKCRRQCWHHPDWLDLKDWYLHLHLYQSRQKSNHYFESRRRGSVGSKPETKRAKRGACSCEVVASWHFAASPLYNDNGIRWPVWCQERPGNDAVV